MFVVVSSATIEGAGLSKAEAIRDAWVKVGGAQSPRAFTSFVLDETDKITQLIPCTQDLYKDYQKHGKDTEFFIENGTAYELPF